MTWTCLSIAAWAQPAPSNFTELKTAIGITDAQITQLQTIQQNERTSASASMTQLQTLRTNLTALLKTTSPAPAAVGTLYLQIDALQKQLTALGTATNTQALGVLTADQKTKLAQLQSAMALEPAVREALALNLLTPPAGGSGRPGPGGFAGPAGFARGGHAPSRMPPPAN